MTTAPALAVEAAATPLTDAQSRAPRAWLGWSLAAAGFAALALSLAVSLTQARAEPAGGTPGVELDLLGGEGVR